jgi:alpha-galactosidase
LNPISRRTFFGGAAAAAATPLASATTTPLPSRDSFLSILRPPDYVLAYTDSASSATFLSLSSSRWQAEGIEIRTEIDSPKESAIFVYAPKLPLTRIHFRWNTDLRPGLLFLGDAWERSYGDLGFRTMVPERVLPWYFATHDPSTNATHGYGVRTGAAAFCFWQVDPAGVSLWMDVSNGGSGVLLGDRDLHVATIVSHKSVFSTSSTSPVDNIGYLCQRMCPKPRLPNGPIYGTNDWYYAYGKNTEAGILRDTALVAELAPKTGPRPFSVIDDGWRSNPGFPDMAKLAKKIRAHNVRPGIWIRPTLAPAKTDPKLLLPQKHFRSPGDELAYDITIPEARAAAIAKMSQVVDWKYELVKHDFSTYDLLGQWGFEMGPSPTIPSWHFNDRSRTNAEILLDYYKALRAAAGDQTILLGCNTVGHLSAGIFEMQRTGDDTSGKLWERTRRMGINTLAYRVAQDRTFFSVDADCVGITNDIPWSLNRQWMDLLARSGTGLFISPSPDAIGNEQRNAISEAFAIAAAGNFQSQPINILDSTTPQTWKSVQDGALHSYKWSSPEGTFPYPV